MPISIINSSPQNLIFWPLVERKISFAFTDFFYLIFSLIIFVIKATLAKIGFTALLKSILATCIVLANKGNWGLKTWTAWHYIWERLTETNMDEQVFALYISSYTQKKTPGTSMYQDWYACFVIWKTRIHVYSFLIGLISSWRHFSNVLGVLFLSGYFYLFDIYTKKSCKQDLSPFWFCHTIYIFAVCIYRRTVSCCCSFE